MARKYDALSILARLLPVLIGVARDLVAARKASSDGGRRITHEEAHVIARNALSALMPQVVEVLVGEDADGDGDADGVIG
jgi:hypothetical protein